MKPKPTDDECTEALQDYATKFGIGAVVGFIREYGRDSSPGDIHPNDRATLIHAARRIINGVPPSATMH